MKKGILSDSDIENSPLLNEENFRKNADFIHGRWRPVTIDGWNTRILDIGKGDPMVFTPVCQNIEVFDSPLIRHFAKKYRVITYQRRESESEILGIDSRSEDLRKVLAYLDIGKAHFVSHSSGSIATTNLALKRPEMFKSYVWMNLSPKPAMDMSAGRKALAELAKYVPLSGETVAGAVARVAAVENNKTLLYRRIMEQFLAIKETAGVRSVRKWFANSVWTLSRYDWSRGFPELKMPILLVNSDNDKVNSMAAMGVFQRLLPNCYGYKIVRGGGHFFQYLRADQVIQYMEEFYGELE